MSPWLDERSRNGGVDEVPVPGLGRLWLCGKHFIGPDPEVALGRTGAAVVVCLNERAELEDRYPDYVDWLLHTAADRAIWFPLPDMNAPSIEKVTPLLDELERRLQEDEGIVIHCGAGVGRAGTIAIALLLRRGVALDDALATVAASRPMAGPQTLAQALFLEELASLA